MAVMAAGTVAMVAGITNKIHRRAASLLHGVNTPWHQWGIPTYSHRLMNVIERPTLKAGRTGSDAQSFYYLAKSFRRQPRLTG
jgi:hypothetical protein